MRCCVRPIAITPEVMDCTAGRGYFPRRANEPQNRRRPSARMARQAPHESARPRKRGRDLDPSSQLPRDRPRAGLAGNAARLCGRLAIPLRERNVILVAAGYAPVFDERPLAAPEMAAACRAVERVLKGHEPFPALAIDRHWALVSANAAVAPLLAGADPALP